MLVFDIQRKLNEIERNIGNYDIIGYCLYYNLVKWRIKNRFVFKSSDNKGSTYKITFHANCCFFSDKLDFSSWYNASILSLSYGF